jgi:hypothetical protein
VYANANQAPIGDVLQSISLQDSLAYLIINNSGLIKVVRRSDASLVANIGGFTTPRYLHLYQNGRKALVTELYDRQLFVLDLASNSIQKTIPVQGWTEQMAEVNGLIYIAERQRPNLAPSDNYPVQRQILVFDPSTESITDSIPLSVDSSMYMPDGKLVKDQLGHLWVSTVYDTAVASEAVILKINPSNQEVQRIAYAARGAVIRGLAYDQQEDIVYWLSGGDGLNKVVQASSLMPFLSSTSVLGFTNWYSLGVDPQNGDLYLSDAIDYVQQGIVYRYDAQIQLRDSFRTGIIPAFMAFE